MPDTGAPWNIPYVAGTDLVSDWPTDSLALANAIASGLDAANTGIGSNVVNVVKVDTFSTTSSSFVDVTGLTVTITPSSATSKVLVIMTVAGTTTDSANAGNAGVRLVRNSTDIAVSTFSANPFTSGMTGRNIGSTYAKADPTVVVLDSPASSSAVTYKVTARTAGGTLYVNRDSSGENGFVSTLTAIEVAA